MQKKCYLSAACVALLAATAVADSGAIGKVVVTPTRGATDAASIPGDIQVLDSSDLAALPGVSLDEKLGAVAGAVSSRSNGIYSFSSVVSLRGFGASDQGRTLVLLDGVSVNTSATGSVNWNRLNLEEVERVEIYKGPASSLYGSEASGGVINIVTRIPQAKAEASADTTYGTYNTYSEKLLAGTNMGKYYVQASGYYLKSDGYISTPAASRTAYTTALNALEQDAGVRAGWKFADSNLDVAYSFYDGLDGEGSKMEAPDGQSRRFQTHFGRLQWQGKTDAYSWQTVAYYQSERYGRVNEKGSIANYTRIDTDGFRPDKGIESSLTYNLYNWLSVTPGFDFKAGGVDAIDTTLTATPETNAEDRGNLTQYAPFAQVQATGFDGRLHALGGVRYDMARFDNGLYNNPTPGWTSVSGDLPANNWSSLNTKFSLGWQHAKGVEQYVSYARGFRAPNLEDMCLTLQRGSGSSGKVTVGNPNLNPETVDTVETGFKLNPVSGLSLEPAVYYSDVENMMYSINTGQTTSISGKSYPVYEMENISQAMIAGAELDAHYTLAGGVTLTGSYAYTKSRILSSPQYSTVEGKRLMMDPVNSAFLGASWENPLLNISGGAHYKDGQFSDDANTVSVNPHITLSAKVWKTFGFTTASLSVDNILDNDYLESESNLAPGRVITAELSLKF